MFRSDRTDNPGGHDTLNLLHPAEAVEDGQGTHSAARDVAVDDARGAAPPQHRSSQGLNSSYGMLQSRMPALSEQQVRAARYRVPPSRNER
jgi:hypothetical protein